MFTARQKWIAVAIVGLAVLAGASGIAFATGAVGDDERPLTGEAREKATAAALAHTGGGTVLESEEGDDGAAYSVEIRLTGGRVVEVNLDRDYRVIGQEDDDDGPGDEEDDDE